MRHKLFERTRAAYDEAGMYHDVKWFLLSVDDEAVVSDVERLLAVKRRPNRRTGFSGK
ncbi:MAG: DUF3788 family protein [Desulfobacterales bacterium]|nr:DUF3788 family protein [Desulfobacterales bacterium]MDD3081285.1 DUF3788 family protein [Desulfobacterales bacterium]MDD3951685.1 DUF3788 family protein [Desulfobacterales bacterium]MDY0377512.1 DUF3788 family protein [Desulfobacterales bacterium]